MASPGGGAVSRLPPPSSAQRPLPMGEQSHGGPAWLPPAPASCWTTGANWRHGQHARPQTDPRLLPTWIGVSLGKLRGTP